MRSLPFIALGEQLDELAEVLAVVPPPAYTARPLPGVSGSIGEHVRHALDHVAALVLSEAHVPLSYDQRRRGTAVETDPAAAVEQVFQLMALIERPSSRSIEDPIVVTSALTDAGAELTSWSTLGREVAFVLSHTIHHQALIAVLLALEGIGVPRRFGYAPSTPLPAAS